MAQKLTAAMPEGLDLDDRYTVAFTAIDATTGNPVAAVKVSNASLLVASLAGGDPGELAFGPFEPMFLPVNFDPPAAGPQPPQGG